MSNCFSEDEEIVQWETSIANMLEQKTPTPSQTDESRFQREAEQNICSYQKYRVLFRDFKNMQKGG